MGARLIAGAQVRTALLQHADAEGVKGLRKFLGNATPWSGAARSILSDAVASKLRTIKDAAGELQMYTSPPLPLTDLPLQLRSRLGICNGKCN